jgi:hypothetical protein
MILGVFEMENIICATMANQVKALLNPFDLFSFVWFLIGSCFGHVMSNATQYVVNNAKVCARFSKVNLKVVQSSLQKSITWAQNIG